MPRLFKLPKWLRVPSPIDLEKSTSNALPWKDIGNPENKYSWSDWEEEVKRDYPIRYFLFETIPFKFSVKIKRPIEEVIYWFKCKLFKKHKYHLIDIRNTNYAHESLRDYNYGYCDPMNQILYASFEILRKHVQNGNPEFQIKHIKEALERNENIYGSVEEDKRRLEIYWAIISLNDWWLTSRPVLLRVYDEELTKAGNSKEKGIEKYKKVNELEEFINNEECMMLKKLADIRLYLWE